MKDQGKFVLSVELHGKVEGLSHDDAAALMRAAHEVCPYSNATRGNIEVKLRTDHQLDFALRDAIDGRMAFLEDRHLATQRGAVHEHGSCGDSEPSDLVACRWLIRPPLAVFQTHLQIGDGGLVGNRAGHPPIGSEHHAHAPVTRDRRSVDVMAFGRGKLQRRRDLVNPIILNPRYSSATGASIPTYDGITIRNFHSLSSSVTPTVTLDGYDASHLTGIVLDNVVVDGVSGSNVMAIDANVTLGPGNVNFKPTGTNVNVTDNISATSQPNACAGKWVAL